MATIGWDFDEFLEEEIDMVVAAYNEIATQIGGKLDG